MDNGCIIRQDAINFVDRVKWVGWDTGMGECGYVWVVG